MMGRVGRWVVLGIVLVVWLAAGRAAGALEPVAAPAQTGGPTVTAVAPPTGSTSGGTIVTITGTGFTGATSVRFGSVGAASFSVVSPTSITATTPAGIGPVGVSVVTPGGTSAPSPAATFTYISTSAITGATLVDGGGFHSCAVVAGGQVRCWGNNVSGQLGNGSTTDSPTPVVVPGITGATQVAAGGFHTCVLVAGGQARCWGDNDSGQLGNGSTEDSPIPVAVPGISGATLLSAGLSHTCVVVAGGQVRCWGADGSGQLGDGAAGADSTSPVAVAGLSGVTQISAGSWHTCALVSGGQARCWGNNVRRQLGNGSTVNSSAPVVVSGLTGATQLGVGGDHACAVVAGGQVRCWGANSAGQLGNGSTTPAPALVAVTGLTGATRVVADFDHTCALVAGGQARCWGANGFGQLGNGSTTSSATLVPVSGLSGSTSAGAGGAHTCAVVAGGEVRCWGRNTSGQLGNGATAGSALFVRVTAASAVPAVGALSATGGPAAGGTVVTVSGVNLTGATAVRFGSAASPSFTVLSASRVVAVTPPGTGVVDVVVETPGGVSAVSGATKFDFVPQPAVASLSVTSGPSTGGTVVTLTGTNLGGATGVRFGAAPAASFTVNSPTQVSATAPPGSGKVGVAVVTRGGTSAVGAANQFTYTAPVPTVTSISPASGPAGGGTVVTLTGTNLTGTSAVRFGTVDATAFVVNSPSQVTATSPVGVAGPVGVTVTTPGGASAVSAPATFTYLAPAALTGGTQVAAGSSHSCLVVGGGQVRCWGGNDSGQLGNGTFVGSPTPVAVVGLSGVTSLAVSGGYSSGHSCAVVAGGQVRCWGDNSAGQLGDGSTTAKRSTIFAVPGLTGAAEVVAGSEHSCARLSAGQVRCWGGNDAGQLGNGTTTGSSVPVTVSGLTGVTALSAGPAHTCAVVAGGEVRCWGANFSGQLGNGSTTGSSSPVAVTGLTGATRVAVGEAHSCALLSGGTAVCWGSNFLGSLGNGTTLDSLTPVAVSGLAGATDLSAGLRHTCALVAGGQGRCWGSTFTGQLGDGSPTGLFFGFVPTPVAVSGLSGATKVSAGSIHSCAVVAGGQVRCWGDNASGQLGNGTTATSSIPVVVSGATARPVVSVVAPPTGPTAGGTAVVISGGNLAGATAVRFGPLVATSFTVNSPTQITATTPAGAAGSVDVSVVTPGGTSAVDGATRFTYVGLPPVTAVSGSIDSGSEHTCRTTPAATVECWGADDLGQLGDGGEQASPVGSSFSFESAAGGSATPVPVLGVTGAQWVTAGSQHSCAVLSGGTVKCWGDNSAGQLGDGLEVPTGSSFSFAQSVGQPQSVPVNVVGLSGAVAVSAGRSHTCALLSGGGVVCWGDNSSGQLGDGTFTTRSSPVPVPGVTGAVSVSAGGGHTCAVLLDGTASCWGANSSWQSAPGSTTYYFSTPQPVAVPGVQFIEVAAGDDFSCARTSTGTVFCWGQGGFGQRGDGTAVSPSFEGGSLGGADLAPADGFAPGANRSGPVAALGVTGAVGIDAGEAHACVVVTSGVTRCWGANFGGQLGGTPAVASSVAVTVTVPGSDGATEVAPGGRHTCARTAPTSFTCWGDNGSGQLGNGVARPTVTSVSPSSGTVRGGTTLTITGTGFVDVRSVSLGGSFGGRPATDFRVMSSTEIAVVVPPYVDDSFFFGFFSTSIAQSLVVETERGSVVAGTFTYLPDPPPTVTSIAPVQGLTSGGATLTITGTNLAGARVGFGCSATSSFCSSVVSAAVDATGTVLTATVPAGSGSVAVQVSTPGNVPVFAGTYQYVLPVAPASVLTASGSHSCIVVTGGQVRCWGDNSSGQLGTPSFIQLRSAVPIGVSGLSGATAAAAGRDHTCTVVAGGQVRCWGQNFSGQLGDGSTTSSSTPVAVPGLTGATQVAAGAAHTCVLVAGGQARCWGSNSSGQLGNGTTTSSSTPVVVSGLSGATAIAAGTDHTCAVVAGGQVRCWGANFSGQLGNGTTTSSTTPVAVSGLSGATRVSAGSAHTSALVAGGQVRCWGENFSGQLGNGTTTQSSTAVAVSGVSGATAVTVGDNHTCVVVAGGQVRCWGDNSSGELGNGTTASSSTAVAVSGLSGATAVAAGENHTCVLVAGGQVRCWGGNDAGQLGNGSVAGRSGVPVGVAGLTTVTQASAGSQHTCGLVAGGQVRCWGENSSGQLGNGSTTNSSTPVAVSALSGATRISAGSEHSCAVVAGGQVRCWGENFSGELGNGSTTSSSTPVPVTGLSGTTLISAGGPGFGFGFSCAVIGGGQVRCWGANSSGQLGNGTTTNSSVPTAVSGLTGVTSIAAGARHTCVVVTGGQVRCWGDNSDGQLGDGAGSVSTTPVAVGGLTGAVQVSAGYSHSCALLSSGEVRCWGANFFGALGGAGGSAGSSVPVVVPGITGATGISSGDYHTCVTVGAGAVRCWGGGYSGGQLGNGTVDQFSFGPVDVVGLSGVTALDSGGGHSCAVVSGQPRCWGENLRGQLGFPPFSTTPVAVLST